VKSCYSDCIAYIAVYTQLTQYARYGQNKQRNDYILELHEKNPASTLLTDVVDCKRVGVEITGVSADNDSCVMDCRIETTQLLKLNTINDNDTFETLLFVLFSSKFY